MLKLLRTYTGIPPNCCSMVLFLWCSAEKDTVSSSLFRTVATKWVAGSGNKNHTNHAQTKRSFNLPTIILQEPMLILGRVSFSKKNCRKVVWSDFLWSLQKKKHVLPGKVLDMDFNKNFGRQVSCFQRCTSSCWTQFVCVFFLSFQDVLGGARLLKKKEIHGEMVRIKGWGWFPSTGFLKDFCSVQIKKNARSEVFTCQNPKRRQNVTTYLRHINLVYHLKGIWDVYGTCQWYICWVDPFFLQISGGRWWYIYIVIQKANVSISVTFGSGSPENCSGLGRWFISINLNPLKTARVAFRKHGTFLCFFHVGIFKRKVCLVLTCNNPKPGDSKWSKLIPQLKVNNKLSKESIHHPKKAMKRITWFKNHKDHQDHGNLRVHHPIDNTPKTIRRYGSSVSLHVMYRFWILQYSFSNRLLWPASSCKTVRFVTYLAPLRGESFSTYYEVLPNFAIPIKRLGEVVLRGFLESWLFKSGHLSVYMSIFMFVDCVPIFLINLSI